MNSAPRCVMLALDRVRRRYDRHEAEYRRGTVFVATVNDADFLVDTTGNSRS